MIRTMVFIVAVALIGMTGFLWGWLWTIPLVVMIIVGTGLYWALPRAYVRVPEKEVAVVYNAGAQAFSHFLSAGQHWLAPGLEVVKSRISTSPRVESNSCTARAVGGVTLTALWKVTYSLDPLSVQPELRANMARTLARNPQDLVSTHVSNCIQHILEHCTVEELCRSGMQGRLEIRMGRLLRQRLLPYGIRVARFIFQEIVLPVRIQAAIESAYERRLQAEAEAQALVIRQGAMQAFTPEDIQRQLELERLRVLEQKQGDAVVLMETRSYHPQLKQEPPDPLQAWKLAEAIAARQ